MIAAAPSMERSMHRNSLVVRDCNDQLSFLSLEPAAASSTGPPLTYTVPNPFLRPSPPQRSSGGESLAHRVDRIARNLVPNESVALPTHPTRADVERAERDGSRQVAGEATSNRLLYLFNPTTLGPAPSNATVARSAIKRRTQSEKYHEQQQEDDDDRSFYSFATVSTATSRRISFYETATESTLSQARVQEQEPVLPVSIDEGVLLDFLNGDTVRAVVVPIDRTTNDDESVSKTNWTEWLSFPWTNSLTRWIMSILSVPPTTLFMAYRVTDSNRPSVGTNETNETQAKRQSVSMILFDDSGIGRTVIGRLNR